MSENAVSLSNLNDFIFCPVSVYFHNLDYETDKMTYQTESQISGTNAHSAGDNGTYSDLKHILQGIPVYCEKYDLYGKIDIFDAKNAILTERKKHIKTIYDGYVFQLYGQYFSLVEMGYEVKKIRLQSLDDNKLYDVLLPTHNAPMLYKFEKLINDIKEFSFDLFDQSNKSKCENCIYEPLCSYSAIKR